ncbi:MAG: hypothetical protein IJ733_17395 [Lachnospiraceae bacterium]|nr:hypothetical protein [Lachnospiraceae bacterium]
MSDKEKVDMLLEQLAMLYRIEEDLKEESKVLNQEINVTEARLNAMGITDFSKLKSKEKAE